MEAPKTETLLIELLNQQHKNRQQEHLFRQAVFSLPWRTKVGKFTAPDRDTIISAGEPYGRWDWKSQDFSGELPQDFSELDKRRLTLPLNGYVPASAIRGVVRSWAIKQGFEQEVSRLLGQQSDDKQTMTSGCINFLDAWPTEREQLSLDIVNPQIDFQVHHKTQGLTPQACNPQPLYTLGNGKEPVKITVAIQGSRKATQTDIDTVWTWLEQALLANGLGGRTASGYGEVVVPEKRAVKFKQRALTSTQTLKEFDFALFSQGCHGLDRNDLDLRPSHWRGWLRSWLLRFLLGVMSKAHAEEALAELMGGIEPTTKKGCIRLLLKPSKNEWGKSSPEKDGSKFYVWKGVLQIVAPQKVFDIVMPVIRFASTVGAVGHGWRRPLHIFHMHVKKTDSYRPAARGALLNIAERVIAEGKITRKSCQLPLDKVIWSERYETWVTHVSNYWQNSFPIDRNANLKLASEIFSPKTCFIYAVPGPFEEPIKRSENRWSNHALEDARETRGEGMKLIYSSNYKRNKEVGGVANKHSTSCSWVSIKRIGMRNVELQVDCHEIVCLFSGGGHSLREAFINDLNKVEGKIHLFGN